MTPELLTAAKIQEILQVDRSTIYRMAEDGRLPAIKVGRQWRFDPVEIDQWLLGRGLTNVPRSEAAVTESEPLSQLVPLDCVQLIQDTFAETVGAMIIVTDMNGNPVTRASNPPGLFAATQESPKVWEECMSHWKQMAMSLDLEPQFTRSSLGLLCARGMIRAGAELKGIVFIGGFAPADWPPTAEQLVDMADRLDVDVGVLESHIHEVHHLAPGEEAAMLLLVQRIANIVSHIIHERGQISAALSARPN